MWSMHRILLAFRNKQGGAMNWTFLKYRVLDEKLSIPIATVEGNNFRSRLN